MQKLRLQEQFEYNYTSNYKKPNNRIATDGFINNCKCVPPIKLTTFEQMTFSSDISVKENTT